MELQITSNSALLNITYAGQNGNYPEPVPYDLDDASVKRIAAEALGTDYVQGIHLENDVQIDLSDFVVDRFAATDELPPRLMIRAKTPFGDMHAR